MSEEFHADVKALAAEFWQKALTIEADPFGTGQLAAADIGRAIAYRDAAKRLRALVDDAEDDGRAEAGEDWNAPDRERQDDDGQTYFAGEPYDAKPFAGQPYDQQPRTADL